jgi:hypothetical protein
MDCFILPSLMVNLSARLFSSDNLDSLIADCFIYRPLLINLVFVCLAGVLFTTLRLASSLLTLLVTLFVTGTLLHPHMVYHLFSGQLSLDQLAFFSK